jgi:hypothetical protein
MKRAALIGVLTGVLGCQMGGDPDDGEVGQTSRALIVGDVMIVYVSEFPIDDAAMAVIDANGRLGIGWTRLEIPALPADERFDLSVVRDEVRFAQEFSSADPFTGEPRTYRVDFISGEAGLTGYIDRRVVDDVGDGATRVVYRLLFEGYRSLYDEVARHMSFDSANDSVMVPEDL